MKCAFIRSTLLIVALILSLRIASGQSGNQRRWELLNQSDKRADPIFIVGNGDRVDRSAREADSIFIGKFLIAAKPVFTGLGGIGAEFSWSNKVEIIQGIKGASNSEINIDYKTHLYDEFVPDLNKPYLFLTSKLHNNEASVITLLPATGPIIAQIRELSTQPPLPESDLDMLAGALQVTTAIFTGYIKELVKPKYPDDPFFAGCTIAVEKVLKGNIDPESTLAFRLMPGETLPEPYIEYIFFVREERDIQTRKKWFHLEMILPAGAATLSQLEQFYRLTHPTPRTSPFTLKQPVPGSVLSENPQQANGGSVYLWICGAVATVLAVILGTWFICRK